MRFMVDYKGVCTSLVEDWEYWREMIFIVSPFVCMSQLYVFMCKSICICVHH